MSLIDAGPRAGADAQLAKAPTGIAGLFIRPGYAIDKVGAKRVVLDTLEALFAGLGDGPTVRANLRRLSEVHLAGRHAIEVIDLVRNPGLAACDRIVAIPTLVRRLPAPIKRIVGNLADTEKTLIGLEIRAPAL